MGDLENQAQAEDAERTPLLAKHQQQQQTQSAPLRQIEPIPENDMRSNEPNEGDEQHEAAALLEPHPQESPRQRTKSWWFWRILWTVLGALVLAVFIKGWVDAKDVDFDLGRALKRALGGGLSGAAAMVLQVLLLMVSAIEATTPNPINSNFGSFRTGIPCAKPDPSNSTWDDGMRERNYLIVKFMRLHHGSQSARL